MIQIQRVSANKEDEIWYIYSTAQKGLSLGETHCELDEEQQNAIIHFFITDVCSNPREIVKHFIAQVIPRQYSYMVEIFTRGYLIDSFNSVETDQTDIGIDINDIIEIISKFPSV